MSLIVGRGTGLWQLLEESFGERFIAIAGGRGIISTGDGKTTALQLRLPKIRQRYAIRIVRRRRSPGEAGTPLRSLGLAGGVPLPGRRAHNGF